MTAKALTIKQLNAIFDGKVIEARMPPPFKPGEQRKLSDKDLEFISDTKKALAKRLGWKLPGFDPEAPLPTEEAQAPTSPQPHQAGNSTGSGWNEERAYAELGEDELDDIFN